MDFKSLDLCPEILFKIRIIFNQINAKNLSYNYNFLFIYTTLLRKWLDRSAQLSKINKIDFLPENLFFSNLKTNFDNEVEPEKYGLWDDTYLLITQKDYDTTFLGGPVGLPVEGCPSLG